MTTLKPTAARMLVLALMFSVLPLLCFCQYRSVHISNDVSEPHELAAYICDDEETTEDEEECDETMAALARFLQKDDDDCDLDPTYCFEALMLGMPTPSPCPSSQCIPFLNTKRICFYSLPDKRPVEIFVNEKRIGTARDVSYDQKKKLRTVTFDVEKNFKNTAAKGENVLSIRIPVTYPANPTGGKPTGEMTQTHLEIAAKF